MPALSAHAPNISTIKLVILAELEDQLLAIRSHVEQRCESARPTPVVAALQDCLTALTSSANLKCLDEDMQYKFMNLFSTKLPISP